MAADPLSLSTRVLAVVPTGEVVANDLDKLMNANPETREKLEESSRLIREISVLLGKARSLVERRRGVYKDSLIYTLRSVCWRFKIIQKELWQYTTGDRKLERVKLLLQSRHLVVVEDKLKALASLTTVVLKIALLAELKK
jgi:hypothetical protein